MTRSLKVYQGEDETPVVDLTEPSSDVHVIWEEVEAGGRAFKGESSLSTFPMRDERAETGNPANLPAGLTHVSLSAGSRLEWLVNGTRLFRGRIGPKDYTRGRQKADRAREVVVSAQDTNYDLRNIIVDGWARPEETDVTRATALVTDFLQGDPRASTNISTTYVSSSNTVTLGAKVYDATSPAEVLGEIALIANKLHFVTIDDELFYDGFDSSTYQAGVRISDRITDLNPDGSCASTAPTLIDALCDTNFIEDFVIPDGLNNSALIIKVGFSLNQGSWPETAFWTATGESAQEATLVDYNTHGTQGGIALYHLVSPNPGDGVLSVGAASNRLLGVWLFENVDQSDPIATSGFATGTGTSASVSIAQPGNTFAIAAINVDHDDFVNDTQAAPVAGAGMTEDWSTELELGFPGERDIESSGGHGDFSPSWTLDESHPWAAFVAAVNGAGIGGGLDVATFPPIWDVGPASTEDGMQLLSGLRLYYGQGSNTYVYVNDPTTANQYWHSEQSLYTSDPAINTAGRATTLANSILQRRKYEERTYNVSIGPLTEDQVGCLKPGQLIQIKARAITDADDQFVSRRIAQLRWTTPVPGTYFAHMMLDRPMKEAPYGLGPKSATDSINRHVEQGSNSHPEYVLRGTLTTQGDLPYRGASDWTRLAIGSSNTYLKSIGTVPVWATLPPSSGGGIAVEEDGSEEGTGIDRLNFSTNLNVSVSGSEATITADGGGSGLSAWRVLLNEWMAESHVNWNTLAGAAGGFPGFRQSSGAQNDELVWEGVALDAGTWNFEANFYRNPGHGIVTVYLDGASVGTIDLYNGGADSNYYASVTGIVIASADVFQLKLKMATKNASATNYYGLVRWPQMRRTS